MTVDTLVYNTLTDLARLPGARMMWGPRPPQPPYFTYESRKRSAFADDSNYAEIPRYRATLFQDPADCDEGASRRFEEAISRLGTYRRHADERRDGLIVTKYDFEVLGRHE